MYIIPYICFDVNLHNSIWSFISIYHADIAMLSVPLMFDPMKSNENLVSVMDMITSHNFVSVYYIIFITASVRHNIVTTYDMPSN